VLFLDELPEFNRQALDSLRQPLETGEVVVARADKHATYPARFQLISAMNPCRCGYLDDPSLACSRAPKCAVDYQSRVSGPLMDRIDIHIDVPAVSAHDLALPSASEGSKEIAERVANARIIQQERYAALENVSCNAEVDGKELEKVTELDTESREILMRAVEMMKLTARGYHRVLRVARTVADLDGAKNIGKTHISEAVNFRQKRQMR
jgi:magnesium chelatase family protein